MFAFQAFIIISAVFVVCLALPSYGNRDEVRMMQVVSEERLKPENGSFYKYDELIQLFETSSMYKRIGTSFSWKNCGSSSDLLIINSLTLTPDPLSIPGTVGFTFDVTVQETFDAPLKLAVELKKHEAFIWFPIPCVHDMGSCTYNNICQKLAGITCPAPFVQQKIPCKCPFPKGRYSLPTTTVNIDQDVPSGEYFVQAQLSYGSKAVSCVQMYFNIA